MKPNSLPDTTRKTPSSLLGEIALPTLLTLLILFCLTQLGLSFWGTSDATASQDATEQYAAISAFAN